MAKTPDPFESPKRRFARAKEHIRRFEKRIHSFLKKEPYERIEDVDAHGVTTHALKFTRNFPDSWADAAVEAIEALRSTLDQTGYSAALLGGAVEPKHAYFPIADMVTDLDSVAKGRCKDLPQEIAALFRRFDAHEGGNYALWALNKLCNANKHRLLVPVVLGGAGLQIRRGVLTGGGQILVPRWDAQKNQIEFAKTPSGGHFQYDADISFSVAFDDFNGVKGGPAVGILDHIAGQVRIVLNETEAECRRIGLLR